jgi:hypothetical protein
MSLTLRRTGLATPVDKDRRDYIVCSGEWAMAVSMKNAEALNICAGIGSCTAFSANHSTCAPMDARQHLRPAKAEFEASWRQWLEWAKLGELNSECSLQ